MIQQIIVYIIIASALLAVGRWFLKMRSRKKCKDNPGCSSCPLKENCAKMAERKSDCANCK